MDLGKRLIEALGFQTVFTIHIGGVNIAITETVVITWVVMALLIVVSFLVTRNLKEIPTGFQTILESFVEFLNNFSKEQFGHSYYIYAPYIGTIFLFLIVANLLPMFSPIGAFGRAPLFELKPPTRDINMTAALAIMTILIVIVGGFKKRGFKGWFKHLAEPIPMMVPFNLMEYIIKPMSLALRLFGNILGAFIIMQLIEAVAPIGIPPVFSLYFDIIDGLIQALVFTFLTSLYIAEAVE
jgi:F-type H+-transporting ATPase subunit a